MIIDRLFTGEDGHTHFGQIEVALEDAGDIGSLSQAFGAESVIFRTNPGSYDFDFHHAPQRQLIVLLDGEIEVENALGEKRRYQSGNVVLAEDLTGSGHRTKSVDGRLRRSLFIPLGNTQIGEPL